MKIFIFDDKIVLVGILLLVIGVLGFIFSFFKKNGNRVNASHGSVAIGGQNSAPINVKNINKNELLKSTSTGMDTWNIICGIATLIGLFLTIIPFLKG